MQMTMKIIYGHIAAVSLLLFAGCSLKEQLISDSRTEDWFETPQECRTGINACYNPIRNQLGGYNFWVATECTTDLMFLNHSMNYNATLDISPTKPAVASTIWQNCYQGVMRTNGLLAAIDRSVAAGNFTEDEALPLKGETIVLRAFFYYMLTCTFGDVPYYTEEVTQENRARIASLPRMPADDTRNALIDELCHWLYPESMGGLESMELKRSYDGTQENRLGAAAGLMIAAKFCLWNGRWEDAIEVIGVLEDIYGHFADDPVAFAMQYPLSDIPFSKKYVLESIFEISNTYEEYGLQVTGSIAAYSTPYQSNVEGDEGSEDEFRRTDVFNGIAIPELGANSRTSTPARPTSYYFRTVLPYGSGDLRSGEYSADETEARNGSGNLAWRWKGYAPEDKERNPEDASVMWFSSCTRPIDRPWLGNKFWCYDMYYTLDHNNYKFFRFADALLMAAEAYLMLGDTDKAADYLNITRTRAGIEPLTLSSVGGNPEAFMEEIRLERARELFGEFQRKFDLVRWGIWYERTLQYNDGMYLPGYIRPYHRYLPIPAEQITYSGGALDNNEYEQ